jgi:hypothetical protein
MAAVGDLAACYGAAILDSIAGPGIDRECLFGLYVNRDREELRRSFGVLRAIREALGGGAIGSAYFAAVYDDPAEAEAAYNMHVHRTQTSDL